MTYLLWSWKRKKHTRLCSFSVLVSFIFEYLFFEPSLTLISTNSFHLSDQPYSQKGSVLNVFTAVFFFQRGSVMYLDMALEHQFAKWRITSISIYEISAWNIRDIIMLSLKFCSGPQETLGYSIRLWIKQNNLERQQEWIECLSWAVPAHVTILKQLNSCTNKLLFYYWENTGLGGLIWKLWAHLPGWIYLALTLS